MLSVIMPVYNEKIEYIKLSIMSILKQTYHNFELIIIDDNPKSNEIKKCLSKFQSFDNRVKIIFHPVNKGIVGSLNDGIVKANGNIIARMDADDVSKPNRFYLQLQFMKKYHLDFVFSNASNINENNRLTNKFMYGKYVITNQKKFKYIFEYCSNISIHPTWMFKKKIWNKIGGYRNIPCAEDYDFLLRAINFDYKLGYQPNILLYKRVRTNSISSSNLYDQFVSVLIIKRFIQSKGWKYYLSMSKFNNMKNNITSVKKKIKFNDFTKVMYSFIQKKKIITFIKMIYKLIFSKAGRIFVINTLLMKHRQLKMRI